MTEGRRPRNGRRPTRWTQSLLTRRRIPPRLGFRYVSDMLTAALIAFDSPGAPLRPAAVARSLGSLVESCVQGLIADALILAAPGRGLDGIADEAGCALIEAPHAGDGLAQALKAARRDHLLLLLAGFAVERGFAEEAQDFFAHGDASRARTLRLAPDSLITRLAPGLARPVGLIAPKSALAAAAEGADLARLVRKMRGADLTTRARCVL
ncbi:transposase [Methylocystis silviterrae]|uniref:transposase n=1 Tax=Methylocystis silviterrae TaxID=2743612 RepID=UPI002FC309B4